MGTSHRTRCLSPLPCPWQAQSLVTTLPRRSSGPTRPSRQSLPIDRSQQSLTGLPRASQGPLPLDPACPSLPLLQSDSQHLSRSYSLNALGSFRLPSLHLCCSLCLEFLLSTHPQTSALPIRSSPVLQSQSSSRNSSQTLLHIDSPNNHLRAMGIRVTPINASAFVLFQNNLYSIQLALNMCADINLCLKSRVLVYLYLSAPSTQVESFAGAGPVDPPYVLSECPPRCLEQGAHQGPRSVERNGRSQPCP